MMCRLSSRRGAAAVHASEMSGGRPQHPAISSLEAFAYLGLLGSLWPLPVSQSLHVDHILNHESLLLNIDTAIKANVDSRDCINCGRSSIGVWRFGRARVVVLVHLHSFEKPLVPGPPAQPNVQSSNIPAHHLSASVLHSFVVIDDVRSFLCILPLPSHGRWKTRRAVSHCDPSPATIVVVC